MPEPDPTSHSQASRPGRPGRPGRLDDFHLLEAAVREAGTLARAHFHAMPKSWSKSDDSPVSEADLGVDRLLAARLRDFRPGYGWLSEESTGGPDRLKCDRVWVVDPIDGTRSFLNGSSEWVISAALVENNVPVLGAVYNPMHEQMFTAMAGEGARLNGQPLNVSTTTEMSGSRLLASARHLKSKRWQIPWPDMNIQVFNALAYRIVMVATGQFDATLAFSRFHEWDVAAADLILSEAGGVMTDFDGARSSYNQPEPIIASGIAANPALHSAIVDFIARAGTTGKDKSP